MSTIYQTRNFSSPGKWLKRIAFTSIFILWLTYIITHFEGITPKYFLIIFVIYLCLIVMGQFDELTITDKEIIIEQKSIIPFLKSKRVVPFEKIASIKKNSNFIHNDGHWFAFLHRKDNNLEVNLIDETCELIDGKLHPKGIRGLEEILSVHIID
jgi:hypothetical protein